MSFAMGALRAAAASVATDLPSIRSPRAADVVEQIESSGQMCVNRARFMPMLRDLMFGASQWLGTRSRVVGVLCRIVEYAYTNILSPVPTLQSLLEALTTPLRSTFERKVGQLR